MSLLGPALCILGLLVDASATSPASPEDMTTALAESGTWLAAFPTERLRFDAAVGLWSLRQAYDSPALRQAWSRARERADGDADNPLRKLWDPEAKAPPEVTSGWEVPGQGGRRVNTNRVLAEALHCRENGWRHRTGLYVAGPMRDGGGYHTTHALWAIVLAAENGCLDRQQSDDLMDSLRQELRSQQPGDFHPSSTGDIDLYGERVLMLILSGDRQAPVGRWVERLLSLQNEDGSWGVDDPDEDPYRRYHATMVATWVLALWQASSDQSKLIEIDTGVVPAKNLIHPLDSGNCIVPSILRFSPSSAEIRGVNACSQGHRRGFPGHLHDQSQPYGEEPGAPPAAQRPPEKSRAAKAQKTGPHLLALAGPLLEQMAR